VRPPAAKLAGATKSFSEEQAWTTDAYTGRVVLKNGTGNAGSDFAFDSVVTGSDNESVYDMAGRDLVL
jgi:hypothetical protein